MIFIHLFCIATVAAYCIIMSTEPLISQLPHAQVSHHVENKQIDMLTIWKQKQGKWVLQVHDCGQHYYGYSIMDKRAGNLLENIPQSLLEVT